MVTRRDMMEKDDAEMKRVMVSHALDFGHRIVISLSSRTFRYVKDKDKHQCTIRLQAHHTRQGIIEVVLCTQETSVWPLLPTSHQDQQRHQSSHPLCPCPAISSAYALLPADSAS